MTAYREKYPVGTIVKIAPADKLRAFMHPEWKYHHPVSDRQLASAGKRDEIRAVGFYHGGDVLYELVTESGMWHEACLEAD